MITYKAVWPKSRGHIHNILKTLYILMQDQSWDYKVNVGMRIKSTCNRKVIATLKLLNGPFSSFFLVSVVEFLQPQLITSNSIRICWYSHLLRSVSISFLWMPFDGIAHLSWYCWSKQTSECHCDRFKAHINIIFTRNVPSTSKRLLQTKKRP